MKAFPGRGAEDSGDSQSQETKASCNRQCSARGFVLYDPALHRKGAWKRNFLIKKKLFRGTKCSSFKRSKHPLHPPYLFNVMLVLIILLEREVETNDEKIPTEMINVQPPPRTDDCPVLPVPVSPHTQQSFETHAGDQET